MAILNIVEISRKGPFQQGQAIPIRGLGGTSQDVAVGGASTDSAAIGAGIGAVRLCADVDCRIAINATATSTSARLPADAIEYVGVKDGDVIAVIAE